MLRVGRMESKKLWLKGLRMEKVIKFDLKKREMGELYNMLVRSQ